MPSGFKGGTGFSPFMVSNGQEQRIPLYPPRANKACISKKYYYGALEDPVVKMRVATFS